MNRAGERADYAGGDSEVRAASSELGDAVRRPVSPGGDTRFRRGVPKRGGSKIEAVGGFHSPAPALAARRRERACRIGDETEAAKGFQISLGACVADAVVQAVLISESPVFVTAPIQVFIGGEDAAGRTVAIEVRVDAGDSSRRPKAAGRASPNQGFVLVRPIVGYRVQDSSSKRCKPRNCFGAVLVESWIFGRSISE